MSQITVFKTLIDKNAQPHYVSVDTILRSIKEGPKQKDLIAQIRNTKDKEAREMLKKTLACICFGGKFKERSIKGLIQYSRLICLDFDKVDVRMTKTKLLTSPFVYAVFTSPSGDGVKALVKVATDNHTAHWLALAKEFPNVDPSGKDVSRVCFMTYDPDLKINQSAQIYTGVIETAYTDDQKLEKLKRWLDNKGHRFVEGSRNHFIAKLAGAMNRFGISETFTLMALERDYVNGTDFSKREVAGVVSSIYGRYADQFGSASFDEVQTETKVTEILSTEIKLNDVIFLKDVESDLIDDYNHGTTLAKTTYFPSVDAIFRPLPGDLSVLGGVGNFGKALDVNTDIPTPAGWKKMGGLEIGDQVFDENGIPCRIINATGIQYNRPCYKIVFSDNTEVIADANHLWFTETDKSLRSARQARSNKRSRGTKPSGNDQTHKRTFASVVSTEEISKTLFVDREDRQVRNHSVSLCKPIHCTVKKQLIPPYVLGAWLGDGTSAGGGFTTGDPEVVENIRVAGYTVTNYKAKYHYGILNLSVQLREIGVLNNKHIPLNYLRGSIYQRTELLMGLMDTDGYVNKDAGSCEFTSTRKQLAADVYGLITSLGIKATIHESDAKIYGKVVSKRYRIFFKSPIQIFKLSRKAAAWRPGVKNLRRFIKDCSLTTSVPVRCIEVNSPSKLFLCTRSFIPTHNSAFGKQLDLVKSVKEGMKHAWFGPEEYPPIFWYRELIRSYIGKPIEPGAPGRMTMEEYKKAMDFVQAHFYYIYPPSIPTPEYILERFAEVIIKEGVTSVTIDPWNQLLHIMSKRDDIYLAEVLTYFERFAQQHGVFFRIIAHPNRTQKDSEGNFLCPDVYDLNGGPVWNARATNICMYHRPFWGVDKTDSSAEFHSKKIKRQMISGLPGVAPLDYKRSTGRFFDNGYNPLETI